MDRFILKLETREQGRKAFRSGLQHGLLTFPGDPAVATGDAVRVDLELSFVSQTVTLFGRVAHTGAVATVVQLDPLPPELYVALGETPPVLPDAEETLVAPAVSSGEGGSYGDETADFPAETLEISDMGSLDGEMADAQGITDFGERGTVEDEPSEEVSVGEGAEQGEGVDGGRPSARPERPPQTFRLRVPDKEARASRSLDRPGRAAPRKARRAGGAKAPDGGHAPVAVQRKGIPLPGLSGALLESRPLREGSLSDISMREVLMDLLRAGTTGVLVVEGFRERFWCFLIDGRPIRFQRDPSGRSEALEYLAARDKRINAGQAGHARKLAELGGQSVETVLERLGYLDREQIRQLQRLQARKMTERLLGVNYGSYHLFRLDEVRALFPDEPGDVMRVLWDRSREQFQGLREKRVAELVDEHHKHHVVLTRQGRALVEELHLPGTEQSFLERYLRGSWQVAELLGRLELPNRKLMELLLALQDLEIIVLTEDEGPNWRRARAERFIIDRMDYMDKDHFAFVEAHWTSLPAELRRACNKVDETLRDPVMDELELERVTEMRNQIRDKVAEVRRIFDDDAQRKEYRAGRVGEDKRRMAADLFARQGEMALFKKDEARAEECFSRVLELNPEETGAPEHRRRAREVLRSLQSGQLLEAREEFADSTEIDARELDDL